MSPKIILTRGISGSGKSFWAKKVVAENIGKWARVNKDDIRTMLHNGQYVKGITEDQVLTARDAMIKSFLKKDINVIVDDTNFAGQHIKKIGKIAASCYADIDVKDFDVPLETCIERDKNREKSVGESVIRKMYKQYNLKNGFPRVDLRKFYEKPSRYVPDTSKLRAITVDIDGTIALMNSGRSPYDESRVMEDDPNSSVIEIVKALYLADYHIVFLSGRHGTKQCRADTIAWINYHFDGWREHQYELFMREEGDDRKDSIIKNEIFDGHIAPHYNVIGVFDDRQQVIESWQAKGLQTFNVSIGDNDF